MSNASSDRVFLGLDMGGTDIKATVTDAKGKLLVQSCDRVLSLAREGPRRTVEQLREAADRVLEHAGASWEQVAALGLDTPGPASLDGVLSKSPNLDHDEWEGFPVRAALGEAIDRPVVYQNDGNAAAFWEYSSRFGDDPTKILAVAILGTGLGGAFVLGGDVQAGARGYGAEFGHIRLPEHELLAEGEPVPRCGCGQLGCAEAYVSLAALDAPMRRALARAEHTGHPLHQVPDEGRERSKRLLALAQEGDALALELFDRQAVALGLLFVQLVNTLDPHLLVVGGGLTESAEEFRDRFMGIVRRTFRERTFGPHAEEVEIDVAGDMDLAGCRGSALLARKWWREQHG